MNNKIIYRWNKLSIGPRTEAFINYLLFPWFSGYWVFPNPKYKGEEIADALLIWGDFVFIIQVSAKEGRKTDIIWAEKEIVEGKERILKWVSRLKTEKNVILKNKYREIEFPREKIKWYYGLIVLNHYSEPYDASKFLNEDSSTHKVAIQVISLLDITNLLKYINTPGDFVNYFESRYRLSQRISIKVHQEESVFRQNIENMYYEMEDNIGKKHADEFLEFMNLTLKAVGGAFKPGDAKLRRYASSFLIDATIGGNLYKVPRDYHGNYIIDEKFVLLLKAIETLSEMCRLRRASWGESFLKQAEKALASGDDKYVTGQSPSRNISYGFIATNKTSKAREKLIEEIAIVSLIKNNQLEGIFVAASPVNIFATYQMFVNWLSKDKIETFKSNMMDALDSTLLYISYMQ